MAESPTACGIARFHPLDAERQGGHGCPPTMDTGVQSSMDTGVHPHKTTRGHTGDNQPLAVVIYVADPRARLWTTRSCGWMVSSDAKCTARTKRQQWVAAPPRRRQATQRRAVEATTRTMGTTVTHHLPKVRPTRPTMASLGTRPRRHTPRPHQRARRLGAPRPPSLQPQSRWRTRLSHQRVGPTSRQGRDHRQRRGPPVSDGR